MFRLRLPPLRIGRRPRHPRRSFRQSMCRPFASKAASNHPPLLLINHRHHHLNNLSLLSGRRKVGRRPLLLLLLAPGDLLSHYEPRRMAFLLHGSRYSLLSLTLLRSRQQAQFRCRAPRRRSPAERRRPRTRNPLRLSFTLRRTRPPTRRAGTAWLGLPSRCRQQQQLAHWGPREVCHLRHRRRTLQRQ